MDHSGSYSLYNCEHPNTSQPQTPGGIHTNHNYAWPILNDADQATISGRITAETATWERDLQFRQLTEPDLDVGLASLNIDDGAANLGPTQPGALTASLDSPCTAENDISVGVMLDACTALKIELDAALSAYRQSREVMLWHAANVCRVNMEYIRALQAINGS